MIDRKEFGKKKKLMEDKVKLKLISKYPHIHQDPNFWNNPKDACENL